MWFSINGGLPNSRKVSPTLKSVCENNFLILGDLDLIYTPTPPFSQFYICWSNNDTTPIGKCNASVLHEFWYVLFSLLLLEVFSNF